MIHYLLLMIACLCSVPEVFIKCSDNISAIEFRFVVKVLDRCLPGEKDDSVGCATKKEQILSLDRIGLWLDMHIQNMTG